MKVKIGDKIYDGANEPVMVILTPEDKKNIANMAEHATKYCMYPDGTDVDWIFEWMDTRKEEDNETNTR
jgi:hypothetical protein